MLLLSELEKAEFFVATDGASELVSETMPSKLETVRIVDSILGVLLALGDEDGLDDGGSGSNLFFVVGGVCEATALGVRLWRGACLVDCFAFGVVGASGCTGALADGKELLFSEGAQAQCQQCSTMAGSSAGKTSKGRVSGKRAHLAKKFKQEK